MLDVIHRILRPLGCELKSNSPVASCILPNGSRVYAALPPVSVHGPTLSLICRDLSTIEVVPDWHVSFTHFDQLHEAKPESKQVDDKEKNSIRIVLNESKTEADLSQNFSARSLRGKKVSFCGTVQLWDDPAWGQDTDEPAEIASCYERGARAYLVACGRGGKCIDQNRMTISLRDVASKSGTQQNGAQQTGASQTFECSLEVPQQAVNLNIGVWLHGPIKAVISDLSFSADKPAMLRAGQGPKNLELVPDSTFRLDE
jgi:hypothetical protein